MNESIAQALLLMVVGMTTVFAFLVLLVFAMQLLAKVLPKLAFLMPDPEPAKPKRPVAKAGDDGSAVAIAIAAALRAKESGK